MGAKQQFWPESGNIRSQQILYDQQLLLIGCFDPSASLDRLTNVRRREKYKRNTGTPRINRLPKVAGLMKAENEMEEFMQLLCSNKRNGPGSINLTVTGCTSATDKKPR